MNFKNIAISSTSDEISIKIIEKLENSNIIEKGKMKPNQLTYCVYIPDFDIIVSHLNLEMHYPQYKLLYGTEFLKQN